MRNTHKTKKGTYYIAAASPYGGLDGGQIECREQEGQPRLNLSDFYRSHTPPAYTGSIDNLAKDIRGKVQAQRDAEAKAKKNKPVDPVIVVPRKKIFVA
jgi:hypothetical protein